MSSSGEGPLLPPARPGEGPLPGLGGPPLKPGGAGDLASSRAAKKKAAGYLENHLAPDTKTDGAHADLATSGVTGAVPDQGIPLSPSAMQRPSGPSITGGPFQGWALSKGLSTAHAVWEQQVKNLLNRLTSERDALRGANTTIHGNDGDTGRRLRSAATDPPLPSKLNDY
ncbi:MULTISPECIES: hypothetical protein [unclassified Streptomyces]|uniref:hypothetical protein n=1 Tax=unclassified Streptomyces TaxID=2593676 RepID=UPI0004C6905B|nr:MULTISPECIES: hypothetical protein [unclassified Streptomyces]QHF96385.1 hypothetical protein DEH18_23915 [Streptomyces sp. NHF165]